MWYRRPYSRVQEPLGSWFPLGSWGGEGAALFYLEVCVLFSTG